MLVGRLAGGAFRPECELDHRLSPSRLSAARRVMAEWGFVPLEPTPGVWQWPTGMLPALDGGRIVEALSASARGRVDVHVLPVTESTSDWLFARPAAARALACFAEYQTGGRGRRGRSWVMPPGSGIALSLRWDVSGWPRVEPGVSLHAGMAVATALRGIGVAGVGLKWPNDLLVDGRKLGGILVEQRRTRSGAWLVVGLGLNVRLPESASIDQPWTDLASVLPGRLPGRDHLAARLLDSLVELFATSPGRAAAALATRWKAFDVLAGEAVRVERGDDVIEGIAMGVDESGRLRVEAGGRQWCLDSGEVRVRRRLS
jgi:BirA family transcriptional regulator, biotin operon repressor / biotin---[acetyl-CoA-carboxylase] ligase